MGYIFNGTTKIITLTTGTTTLDVRDLYSRWKEWTQTDGAGFLQAMSVVGGEPVDVGQGIYVTSYFFLENGWKIKPQEANHKLIVKNGILIDAAGGDPFVQTTGNYNVLIQYSQPVKSETVSISGSSITPSEVANAVWDEATASHIIAGTMGKAMNDAGSAGNPWSSPIVGNTTPGTFGELIGKKMLTVAKFLGLK